MKNINKEILTTMSLRLPYILILLLMIFISPVGAYLFTQRAIYKKNNMYNNARSLIGFGFLILFLIGIGIYSKVKEIIQLYDSGMSFDMINFLPDHVWLYILGILLVVSYIYFGKKLLDRTKVEQVYTYIINVEHKSSLKIIGKELDFSISKVKNDVKMLSKFGYLLPLEINEEKNKIIYTDRKNHDYHYDSRKKQCAKCGALITFKDYEYTECDFCGNGILDEN